MGQPNRILRPDDFATELDDVKRRLKDLETAPSLSFSSIKGGALIVKDNSGVQRARLGLLADGVTYGLEVDDATGTSILDSIGLIQGIKLVGSSSSNDTSVNLSTVGKFTFVGIGTGVTTTFTPPRTGTFMIVYMIQGRAQGAGAGTYAYGACHIDGTVQGGTLDPWALWDKANAGFTGFTGVLVKSLSGAAHTIDMRISTTDNTVTWWQYQTQLLVFQIGG